MNDQQTIGEIQGFIGLGMKRDALALARACFQRKTIEPLVFAEAVNALLSFGGNMHKWRCKLESAFERVPGKLNPQVRFVMLSYYASLPDYSAASRFIPRTFTSDTALVELVISLEILIELNQMHKARRLARACLRAGKAQDSIPFEMQSLLIRTVALYFAAARDWDNALRLWQPLRSVEFLAEEATFHCVKIRLEQASEELAASHREVEKAQSAWKSGYVSTAPDHFSKRLSRTKTALNRTRRIMLRLLDNWSHRWLV